MNSRFRSLLRPLPEKLSALLAMDPARHGQLPRAMPARGVYLFSEGKRHLYVGRTNRLRQRLGGHWRPAARPNSATFAFRVARGTTGRVAASYAPQGSRTDLLNDPKFAKAFIHAKARLRKMEVRFVEETDPTTQALLEIYVATALETPYNDFDNH